MADESLMDEDLDTANDPAPPLDGMAAATAFAAPAPANPFAGGPFADIPITLKAVLGQVTMPISTLMNLKQGELLPLDKRVGEPIDIIANGNPIARGELVVVDEDPAVFCVQITEILTTKRQA